MSGRAIVVGAGIVGASVALELVRRGWNVRVVERSDNVGRGSTAFSASVVRCHYTWNEAVALALEGRMVWETWSEYTRLDSPRAYFNPVGVLFILGGGDDSGPGPSVLGIKPELSGNAIADRVLAMQKLGVNVELLAGPYLQKRFSRFHYADDNVLGVYEKDSGYVAYPTRAVEDLREAGEEEGVTYWLQSAVVGAEYDWVDGRRVVRKAIVEAKKQRVRLECDIIVNCAGPESHAVNMALGCPIPTTTAPLQQYIIEGTWENLSNEELPAVADMVEGFYMRPDQHAFKIGAALPRDHVEFVTEPDGMAVPEEVDAFQEDFLARLERRIPGVELKDVRTMVSYYDWTVADAYPILGDTEVGGYYVAIGTSGAWFKGAPVIGFLMAELIERRRRGDNDNVFTLPRSGNDINLSVFGAARRGPGAAQTPEFSPE